MATVSQNGDITAVLASYDRHRQNLIPILQEVQDHLSYLSPQAVEKIAEYLGLSENDVFGVATFYAQFRFHPPGEHHIKVCQGTACHVRGSGLIMEAVIRKLGITSGETTEDLKFSLERVACFGSCALAPVVVVDDKVFGRMTPRRTQKLIEGNK